LSDKSEEKRRVKQVGLHYCRQYGNLVRFNPKFCGSCPYNGMKQAEDQASETSSETCF
jgi:hypothetical protein